MNHPTPWDNSQAAAMQSVGYIQSEPISTVTAPARYFFPARVPDACQFVITIS